MKDVTLIRTADNTLSESLSFDHAQRLLGLQVLTGYVDFALPDDSPYTFDGKTLQRRPAPAADKASKQGDTKPGG